MSFVHHVPKPTNFSHVESVVVREGYINKNTQISELNAAGRRLMDFRDKFYYNGVGDPSEEEDFIDPTSRKDFDFSDADRLGKQLDADFEDRKNARKTKIENEKRANTQSDQSAPVAPAPSPL